MAAPGGLDQRALVVEGIEWSERQVTGRYLADADVQAVAITASEAIGRQLDPFLALGLLPAMKLGVPLRLPGQISPRLLEGTRKIQEFFSGWRDDLEQVAVEADVRREDPRPDGGVAAFFSGGVDSFYTVLKNREKLTDLIFVHGLDIALAGQEDLRRQGSEMAKEVAAALGKQLIEVEADIRAFSDRHIDWGHYYGSALAAIALLFQNRLAEVMIPADQSYPNLFLSGSHPLVDPHWSTEQTEVVNDGAEAGRVEKVAFIAESELAMRLLRVCWENPDGAYNCGRCEKCLRTMINLRAVGAEGKCRTLPGELSLRQVRHLSLGKEPLRVAALENLRALEASGGNSELTRAIRAALRADRLRKLRAAVRARARRIAPAWMKRGLRAARDQLRARARV